MLYFQSESAKPQLFAIHRDADLRAFLCVRDGGELLEAGQAPAPTQGWAARSWRCAVGVTPLMRLGRLASCPWVVWARWGADMSQGFTALFPWLHSLIVVHYNSLQSTRALFEDNAWSEIQRFCCLCVAELFCFFWRPLLKCCIRVLPKGLPICFPLRRAFRKASFYRCLFESWTEIFIVIVFQFLKIISELPSSSDSFSKEFHQAAFCNIRHVIYPKQK